MKLALIEKLELDENRLNARFFWSSNIKELSHYFSIGQDDISQSIANYLIADQN